MDYKSPGELFNEYQARKFQAKEKEKGRQVAKAALQNAIDKKGKVVATAIKGLV